MDDKKPETPAEPIVVFKLSDARASAKKQAAKDRRSFMRDRQRDKVAR